MNDARANGEETKMYGELAGWWQLISPTADYADEAAFFAGLFREAGVETLLELGSGGGNIAWFLKSDFALTLSDLSAGMLAESEKQNPELEHVRGDMRVLRLERTFDGVFVHDAIMYMTTEDDLRSAFLTASISNRMARSSSPRTGYPRPSDRTRATKGATKETGAYGISIGRGIPTRATPSSTAKSSSR